jgi:hypothetical protein
MLQFALSHLCYPNASNGQRVITFSQFCENYGDPFLNAEFFLRTVVWECWQRDQELPLTTVARRNPCVERMRIAKADYNLFPDRGKNLLNSPRLNVPDFRECQIVDVEIYKYRESVVLLHSQRQVVRCITDLSCEVM